MDSGTNPLEEHSYTVSIVSADGSSDGPQSSPPLVVHTPRGSRGGDAPYCPSSHIRSIEFDWNGYTEPNGSDLWPVTWGRDGKVYTFFGDGGGFGGDNYRGRASFGVASMAGSPPKRAPDSGMVTPPMPRNVFGGFQTQHPSTLSGKAGAIIAVGRDFYALGGIWSAAELGSRSTPRSGSPNRVQLIYSRGNAYSWQVADWAFCSDDAAGDGVPKGHFCPFGFVNYGPGNGGAPDGWVYLLGTTNRGSLWNSQAELAPAETFLARVNARRMLDASAYEYYDGLDARGKPLWSGDPARGQPIFADRNEPQPGCGALCDMRAPLEKVVFNRALRRYIGVAQGRFVGQTSFYDAPEPWGPWTVIDYNNIDPLTGSGGWGNLGTAAGESLGVHIINAWTSADGLTLWMTYSSNGRAPEGAAFPPAGTSLDSFNLISARLIPGTRTGRKP